MGLDKIKGLRGVLYRKVKSAGKKEEIIELPGFVIPKIKRLVEFPKMENLLEINITYPLIEPFAYANIKWNSESKELMYYVIEPPLSEKESDIIKKVSEGLIELVEVEMSAVKEPGKAIAYLEKNIKKVLKSYGMNLTANQYTKLMYYIYRNFIGYNEIEPFLQDPYIEDISCDGNDTPLYIIHRKYGSLKTNIIFKDAQTLREFIIKIAERCGRYVSYAEPILTGTLPDGSRVSATIAGDVATRGPIFTIRKFTEKPISPIEQLDYRTISSEVLAYLWYLIEHGVSMLIVGGVATGKTSFLNSLCMFIPPEAKIVSIEDTRELRIPNEHWVPGLARAGFGIPMATGEKYGGVSLFDLLKESFRQNPDYVVVGEVRGEEAYVMFQGMSSGHPCMSTFHAGSIDTVIKRLTSPPIELSPTLIESLDVMCIMIHAREKGKSARRCREIAEVESVDPETNKVETRTIFVWNPAKDSFEKVGESEKLKKIVAARGGKAEYLQQDLDIRKKVLDWMRAQGIKDYIEVVKYINMFYKERDRLMRMIGEKPVAVEEASGEEPVPQPEQTEAAPVAVPAQAKGKSRRVSIFELLGFKLIKEK